MLTYDNGVVIASKGKSKITLSNQYCYLGYYYGYKCFRPTLIERIEDLNNLKSRLINHGWAMDWITYQWCLNNFEKLKEM